MSTLHEQAWGAYVSAQADETAEARQILATVLAPFDPTDLTVAAVDVSPQRTRMVLTDETTHLAVIMRTNGGEPEVHLVAPQPGNQWQDRGQVTSLAELGKKLGPPPPPDGEPVPADWIQRHSPDGYELGDRVTHNGKVWECVAVGGDGKNQWEPGEYGWVEVV